MECGDLDAALDLRPKSKAASQPPHSKETLCLVSLLFGFICPLAGADQDSAFGERTRTLHFAEGLRVHINWAPDVARAKTAGEVVGGTARRKLILFALPNGNTIEQTVGCRPREGLDWHYNIQHIGAQVRRLREIAPEDQFIIAYLEADRRSWPAWKTKHSNYRELIPRILARIEKEAGEPFDSISLLAHSGGGSLIHGIIDSHEHIPDRFERIAFLDANYGYDDALHHGDKLIEWLKKGEKHVLCVVCYDDRHIRLNGKPVLSSPEKGTWGATQRTLERFGKDIDLSEKTDGPITTFKGLNGCCEFILHANPENKILHTVLVGDMSGFLHAMTLASAYAAAAGPFAGPVTYDKWIQPEPLATQPAESIAAD